jgi:two-component sensor histidine kinase
MVVAHEERDAAARLHDDFLLREQGKDGSVCTVLVTALREVAHRVKNHLNSLKSMSRLYDRLQRDPSVTTVGLNEYLETLISDIVSTGVSEERRYSH